MAISTFMGLETNKRGLTAQQTALYTVGHNISNANTIGYTRQRVNLEATTGFPSAGMNAPMMAGHLGTGVTSESITRIRDQFVDKQYRQETNNLGFWSQQTNAISQMEDIMSEPSEYGLNAAFDDFYTAWQTLANEPSSSAARQVVYTKASHLASSFNYMNTQMTQVQQNLKYEALNTVDNVNSILKQIASLNNQIKQVEPNGYIPNELYDERDKLLDELSEYIPIATENLYSGGVATDAAEGAINVYLVRADGVKQALVSAEPTGTQNYNGQDRQLYGKSVAAQIELTTDQLDAAGNIVSAIVSKNDTFEALSGITITQSNEKAENATVTTDAMTNVTTISTGNWSLVSNASGGFDVTNAGVTSTVVPDTNGVITLTDTSGAITTLTLTRDNNNIVTAAVAKTGTTISEGISFKSLSMEKGSLTSYAVSYGYTEGTILTDASGNKSLETKGFFYDKLNDLDTLAREFATAFNAIHESGYPLSDASAKDATTSKAVKFFDTTDGTTDITAANIKINDVMSDFNNIAASDGKNEEGNGNLAIQLSNLKTTAIAGLNGASAAKFYESMVADVGTQGEKSVRMEYNSGTIQLTISNNRDSITSVSLDEEMTDMIRFQQAYNASARMMTTIDETLEKIINGMGRVGL